MSTRAVRSHLQELREKLGRGEIDKKDFLRSRANLIEKLKESQLTNWNPSPCQSFLRI